MKRALSLFLALCLLVSILPASVAATSASEIVYTFTRHSIGASSNTNISAGIKSTSGGEWEILSYSGFNSTPQLTGAAIKLVGNQKSTENQSFVLFKVKAPASGNYTASVIYDPSQAADTRLGKFNVYFFSASDLAGKSLSESSDGESIAAAFSPINAAPVSMKENTSATLGTISVTGSEEAAHYLMIEVYGALGKVDDQVHLTSFTLTPATGEPEPEPDPDPNPGTQEARKHTLVFNRTAAGSPSDNVVVSEGVKGTVDTDPWECVSLSTWNTRALYKGYLQLVVTNGTVGVNGYMVFKFSVDGTGEYVPTVTYAETNAGREGEFSTYIFSDEDLAQHNITTSDFADIAEKIGSLDNKKTTCDNAGESVSYSAKTLNANTNYYIMLELTGAKTAGVKANDMVRLASVELNPTSQTPDPGPSPDPDPEPEPDDPNDDGVSANVLQYNFNSYAAGVEKSTAMKAGTKSIESETAKWEAIRNPQGFSNYALYDAYLMLTQSSESNGATIKITVDKARMYMPSVTYRTRNRGAMLEVYLIDSETVAANGWDMTSVSYDDIYDKLDPLDNKAIDLYIADPDTSAVGTKHNFRGINLARGTYYLVFRANGKNPENTNTKPQLFIDNFTLETTENDLKYVEITSSKDTLDYGEMGKLTITGIKLDGTVIPSEELSVKFTSSDAGTVHVDGEGNIKGLGSGKAKITVSVSDGSNTVTEVIEINAVDNTGIKEGNISAPKIMYVSGHDTISWKVTLESGNIVVVPFDSVECKYSEEGIVSINSEGKIEALAEGDVSVTLSANFRNTDIEAKFDVSVGTHQGKTAPTYYTYEKRANAVENVAKYDWARSEMKSVTKKADKYIQNLDAYYEAIAGEGIPRSNHIGYLTDPTYTVCKWCGVDVTAVYGSGKMGGWILDIVNKPWKIQCPGCKRTFPTNDFELLYERGLDENGLYNRELAIENNAKAVENGEKDALVNELYSELDSGINLGAGLREGETVEGWGVDDGFGYVPRDKDGNNFVFSNGVKECHAYIPYYMNYAWNSHMDMISTLATAYLYTGDIKYGRAGAIFMDRVADFYPTFNASKYKRQYHLSDGGSKLGHIQGRISESSSIASFALNIDALYPAISDPGVISYLSKKAVENGTADKNDKSSAAEIWRNWEENMLMVMPVILKTGRAQGNTGLYQYAMACAAIVLDREPYTTEMIDWIYANDDINTTYKDYNTTTLDDSIVTVEGGDFGTLLINQLDRDGVNNESSVSYNAVPISRFSKMADVLSFYKGEKVYNPYAHPKYVSMLTGLTSLVTINNQSINVGDNIGTAQTKIKGSEDAYITLFNLTDDEELRKRIAEFLYLGNGCSTKGITNSIFSKDPDNLDDEIESYIDGMPVPQSRMMTGYGFAILCAGENYISASIDTATNTLRDFWMYFGGFVSHGHGGTLNLGIESYGLNIAPDLGYAEEAGTDPMRLQWVGQSLSHNVVSVNRTSQKGSPEAGIPINFDDSGKIKFMEVSAPDRYAATSEYRRAIVMIEVDDNVSYGVDFYRVKGGEQHTYSFHSQAENAYGKEGLDFTPVWDENGNYVTGAQTVPESGEYTVSYWNDRDEYVTEPVYKEKGEYIGSYADIKHEAGKDPNSPSASSYVTVYPRGYAWLGKVRRDETPESKFSVEFDVEDYRKTVAGGSSIVLRVTQFNDWTADEVSLVSGPVPNRSENRPMPSTLDYMLVQRKGEDLDSLFTTVYEPYKGERYLSDMNAVEIKVSEASEVSPKQDDVARAVKVEHTNGRCDYVIYSTNNAVTYTVDGKFEFRGAAGVITINSDGVIISRYVCNGDIIGSETGEAARITGTIAGFSEELTRENYIDIYIDDTDLSTLTNKYIHVENDGVENGVYNIKSIEKIDDGVARIYTGDVTLIRSYRDSENLDAGYIYNIAAGQKYSIPLACTDYPAPEFMEIKDVSVAAESAVKLNIKAESDNGAVTYEGLAMPRGATINAETGEFSWKPTSSQTGENHVAITARDAAGRENTIHFYITVYGSTTGLGSASGGAGGGGGGAAPAPSKPAEDDKKEDVPTTPSTPSTPSEPTTPSVEENVRFVDLGAHAWAADAINALADEEIIKGTSENTFSPAANITRADFALLLVRAFKLTSDNTENFADVADSDYFAKELAIARNTGIAGGIGDNKYAPRNTITRQDMMTIVYRALATLEVAFESYDDPKYDDYANVADYAKDAVKTLIGAGLVNGKSGKIAPADYTTRAEVAVLIKRILEYTK